MATEFSTIEKPSRWNASFDPDMTQEDVDRVLSIAPFKDMDPNAFSRTVSLRNIVRHDTRIRKYQAGEIVVREGDYGNSAFLILARTVEVVLSPLPPSVLGRRDQKKKSLFKVIAQLWNNPEEPEMMNRLAASGAASKTATARDEDVTALFVQDVPRVLRDTRTATMREGDFFGEIAALSRMPRTATVVAKEPAELLEIRWQGLRDLMKYDQKLREHINRIYRERTLKSHLLAIPLFKRLAEADLELVVSSTTFETYGQYDWSGEYKRMASVDPALRTGQEPIIASEGDYPNGIVLMRAGFARLSQKFGHGERTLNYLGAGHHYGLSEIVHNWRHPDKAIPLRQSLRAVGYTHVMVIPTAIIEERVLPTLPESEISALMEPAQKLSFDNQRAHKGDISAKIGAELFGFLADHRFFNGTATMVIDLDRCTRCDDCVRACSSAHDNNPRFLRQGPSHGNIMIANACMHCVDPVCMIGCPTGAIGRTSVGGQVVINPVTCIGCKTCFNNCPYDAIRMVEMRGEDGSILVDQEMKPIAKATKCDLCIEQITSPACQKACPHGALTRMNMNDLNAFASWLKK